MRLSDSQSQDLSFTVIVALIIAGLAFTRVVELVTRPPTPPPWAEVAPVVEP